jgi:uncharacterized protein YndB with AHSA1/START domain
VVTLPSGTEIEITRVFDASAGAVFRAFTTPELVKRWWAEEGDEWIVCAIDLRPGGRWRWVFRHGQIEVGFHGEYREVSAPHRLVYTELFEMPRAPLPEDTSPLTTLSLVEEDAMTTMTLRSQYPSVELRDLVLASGMEEGMQRSYDRLDGVVSAA